LRIISAKKGSLASCDTSTRVAAVLDARFKHLSMWCVCVSIRAKYDDPT
jgi:hypothetical protein